MWVFDGEEWTQDNGGVDESAPKPASSQPQPWPAELVPELQVIEIVHEVPQTWHIPVPLP